MSALLDQLELELSRLRRRRGPGCTLPPRTALLAIVETHRRAGESGLTTAKRLLCEEAYRQARCVNADGTEPLNAAADRLGISRKTVWAWARKGRAPE